MAMLTMPDRSHRMPLIAPKTSGTDSARAPWSSVVTGMTVERPAPTQVRKAEHERDAEDDVRPHRHRAPVTAAR